MILTFTSSVNRSRALVFYRVWTDLSFLSGKRTSIRACPLDPRVVVVEGQHVKLCPCEYSYTPEVYLNITEK